MCTPRQAHAVVKSPSAVKLFDFCPLRAGRFVGVHTSSRSFVSRSNRLALATTSHASLGTPTRHPMVVPMSQWHPTPTLPLAPHRTHLTGKRGTSHSARISFGMRLLFASPISSMSRPTSNSLTPSPRRRQLPCCCSSNHLWTVQPRSPFWLACTSSLSTLLFTSHPTHPVFRVEARSTPHTTHQ